MNEVIGSSGHPLDPGTRASMESRFGHDFSRVRVHHDARAAASADAVHARAYTVGSHVVFGGGQFRPSAPSGARLLTHELTHVVQQGGHTTPSSGPLLIDPSPDAEREAVRSTTPTPGSVSGMGLQRACLPAADCVVPSGQGASTQATVSAAAQVARRQRREQLCSATPRDPACTSDGHSARATNLEAVLNSHDASRMGLVTGIFVDRDIPTSWRAYHRRCDGFTPPVGGPEGCIFAPHETEQEAGRYLAGDAVVGGMPRNEWSLLNLRVLMHETGHARFENIAPATPSAGGCNASQIRAELQEMAADMDEIDTVWDVLTERGVTPFARDIGIISLLRSRYIRRANSNWKHIRCTCSCGDAATHLRHVIDNMTLGWPFDLLVLFHSIMRVAVPGWPVSPPQPPGMGDFPMPSGDTRRA